MSTLSIPRRLFVTLHPAQSKFKFYDLVLETRSNRHLKTRTEITPSKSTFQGNYKLDSLTPEERIAKVFGGRIKGETRQSSSRINVGEPRKVAGVMVPDKPREPDNCCMSGCINCVWELYNDDVKEWNGKRKEAALKLRAQGGVWPNDFYPPVQYLGVDNLPKGVSMAATQKRSDEESWGNVPVQIRVFAEMEKRMKEKKRKAAQTLKAAQT